MSWYNTGMYESQEKLNQYMKYRTFRKNRGTYSIAELLSIIKRKEIDGIDSFITLSGNVPLNIIPYGRDQQEFIDRDFTFYRYSQKFFKINPNLRHTLIISITGHEAATAAVFAEENIPTSWNVNLEEEDVSTKRILEMLQDYAPIIANNSGTNNSNMGIILETQHGLNSNVDISKLPNIELLRKMGINNCVIFTEDIFQGKKPKGCYSILKYIELLKKSGISISYFGIGDRQGDKADFTYSDVTHSIDVPLYLTNFKSQNTIQPEQENAKQLSTSQVGRKTTGVPLEDTASVTETFEQWKKRMIEMGILK